MIRICEIKRRAERIGSSLKAACDATGVQHSSAYRWLGAASNPGLQTYEATCLKLEAWLDRQERALLGELAARHLQQMVAAE